MKRLLGALTWVVALLAAFPVARAETPDSTLVMAMNIDDIISLDPAETFELVGGEVIANVYDRITVYEPGAVVELTGGVAESWDVADDGHTIILHVRPDQTFHSGNPVTAADVVFSLTRVIKLNKTPSFIFSQFGWSPENVDQMVRATDDMTVELKIPELRAPTLVLNCLAAGVGSVVDQKVALEHESNGDLGWEWLKTSSAGSGPFSLRSWKPNESVILDAQGSRYGKPAMERVILRHVPEPGAQRLLIEKGDADIARNLTADQIAGLEGNSDIVIQTDPKATLIYLQVNMRDPVLSEPKVREALRYLVDYQGMADSFLRGQYIVHQSFWPSGFFASLTDNPFALDVAKAKALLAEAGHGDGIKVEMDAFNTAPYADIAQAVQATMGEAGINVSIEQAETKAVYPKHRARNFQMILTHWSPDYLDPHSNADAFASNPDNSDEAKLTGVIAWRGAWETPENTALTAAARQELDAAKREEMYLTLQKNVQQDSPFVFMFQQVAQAALRSNVSGFISGPSFDQVFYRDVVKN
jgi:peptide/nickel transport system substrate-binding protein